MNATERLLRAAKFSEIEQLSGLAETAAVVGDICRFVHALQRERGASTIYLGSAGRRFTHQRQQRIADSRLAEATLRRRLDEWASFDDANRTSRHLANARLLTRIAAVWHGFDSLPPIRDDIEAQRLTADDAVRLFNRLISNLLSVIFEAADTASDTEITRVLVCLFHFIQGKELAGQERACGAFGFTLGVFDDAHRQTLQQLIDAQHRCFETFGEFASTELLSHWQQELDQPIHLAIAQLRDLAIQATPLPNDLDDPGEQWYAIMTQRIDAMKDIEDRLVEELQRSCRDRIHQAEREIENSAGLREALNGELWAAPVNLLLEVPDAEPASSLGALTASTMESRFSRSLVGLVQTQHARLQQISDELESTRKTLRDRKQIDRAKGLLMTHQRLSEEEAYRLMRKTAMDQSKPLIEVARNVIDLVDMLSRERS
ncbi:nitrate- and nitrite sensing domain-containing protein [Salinicola sp. 4072]|uniref:nitrate- and nitrite sensing domain-containing protein n=1 Tax=Salinicola sp. 4072 TaxID=3082157 RepID=UPI002FCA1E78